MPTRVSRAAERRQSRVGPHFRTDDEERMPWQRSVVDGARPMPRLRALVLRLLPAVPQQVVEPHRGDVFTAAAELGDQQLDGVERAGADLDLLGRAGLD